MLKTVDAVAVQPGQARYIVKGHAENCPRRSHLPAVYWSAIEHKSVSITKSVTES